MTTNEFSCIQHSLYCRFWVNKSQSLCYQHETIVAKELADTTERA